MLDGPAAQFGLAVQLEARTRGASRSWRAQPGGLDGRASDGPALARQGADAGSTTSGRGG
jgi:hypothetical protein